ncbi:hypothetical protein BBJ28_00018106 [Nothophytophthora sp. Chile5]|nr:hypothetical protein BBJ28_00018106 [Nothophytophthora sp. Chile5]
MYDDIHCHSRRFVLLEFCPLDDETDLGAQSVFNLLADTLSRYGRPWGALTFMVGDNCSVNRSIGRKIGAVPFIGCASHRFNLAMNDYLSKKTDLLNKIHALMKGFSTLKGRAVLRQVTPWLLFCVMPPLVQHLRHGGSHNLGSAFLSRREHEKAEELRDELLQLEGITKTLQRSTLTLSATRRLFDQVMQKYPAMKSRLSPDAPIVNYPALESGLVKLQRGQGLNAAERVACKPFQVSTQPDTREATTDKPDSIVVEAFKRRRVSRQTKYVDVSFMPPTSNECERFFSAAKLQLTDLRKKMDAETIEKVMLLSFNREMWS